MTYNRAWANYLYMSYELWGAAEGTKKLGEGGIARIAEAKKKTTKKTSKSVVIGGIEICLKIKSAPPPSSTTYEFTRNTWEQMLRYKCYFI